MTEDNTTEAIEAEGVESGSAEDSPVINKLRQELREAKRELKSVPSRSELEAEIRSSLQRESAIKSQLVAFGQPEGLMPLVEEKLGDAEVAPEKVAEALKAIGFEISDSEDGGEENQQVAENLAEVANLGSQVAQAASGGVKDNLTDKINAAETPEALAQVMREAGLSQ